MSLRARGEKMEMTVPKLLEVMAIDAETILQLDKENAALRRQVANLTKRLLKKKEKAVP